MLAYIAYMDPMGLDQVNDPIICGGTLMLGCLRRQRIVAPRSIDPFEL